MMNAIKYMDELEEKGFTSEQAKASVNLWIEIMNDNFATKNDIKDVLHKMELMESRLSIKLGKILVASIGAAVGALSLIITFIIKF